MILFCTRSLKYSTDVPVVNAGLVPLTSVDSECSDCASKSLEASAPGLNTIAVGVVADA